MHRLTWLIGLSIALSLIVAISACADEPAAKCRTAIDKTFNGDQILDIGGLSEAAGSGGPVHRPVVGLRPGLIRVIEADDILRLPTRGYTEVTGLQPGAVQLPGLTNTHDGPVSIRACLPSEMVYLVDGISRKDYASGHSVTFLDNNTIEEITVANNAYDASYAQVSTGVVNVTTKSGSSFLHGTAEGITDNFHGENYDYNSYSASLSGPLMPHSDKLTFAADLERGWYGDAEPHSRAEGMLPHQSSGLWNWHGKINWKPVSEVAVNAGILGSNLDAKLFSMPFYFDRDHAPRTTEKNNSAWLTVNHELNDKTSYTLAGNWFSNKVETGDGVYFDDIWAYSRPDGNYYADDTYLFYRGDNPNTPSGRDHEVTIDPTYGYGYITVDGQDIVVQDDRGFVRNGRLRETVDSYIDQGLNPWDAELILRNEDGIMYADESWVYEDYQKRHSSYVGVRADFIHELLKNHTVDAGGDFQYHTLRYYRHYAPQLAYRDEVVDGIWDRQGGFADVDHYGYDAFGDESDTLSEGTEARHPYNYSLYVLDKCTLDDMAVNAGVRYDSYQANTRQLRFPATPLGDPGDGIGNDNQLDPTDFEDTEAKTYISPRLSVAVKPVDKTVIHFSYGKFLQQTGLADYFSGWDFMNYRLTQAGYPAAFGNPALDPTRTQVVEFGFSHRVSNAIDFDVTGFYRDVQGYTTVIFVPVTPGASGRDFFTYDNGVDVIVRGLEAQLNLKQWNGFTAQINYAYAATDASGPLGSYSRNIAWTVSETPIFHDVPWMLERTHNLAAIFDAHLGEAAGPRVGNLYPLERSGLNVVFRAGSGFPYTPYQMYNAVTLAAVNPVPAGDFNSERTPAIYRVDLKLDKQIPIAGKYVDFYVWILNVFNRENVINVYGATGQADNAGWLNTNSGHMFIQQYSEPDWTGLNGEQKYLLRENDPYNYDTPRQIRFGARVSF